VTASRGAGAALILAAISLSGCGPAAPDLRIEGAWARPTSGVSVPAAIYLSVVNDGRAADRLLEIRTERCAGVEIHRTRVTDNRMSMEPVSDGVEIPARSTVEMKPGGTHIMLFELTSPLAVGERFAAVAVFERSGDLAFDVEIRRH
jgi:copper(I)-binding protein